MNSNGDLYVTEEMRRRFEEEFGKPVDASTDPVPDDALAIDSEYVAGRLALMNRAARRAFMSERRKGRSEMDALDAAERTLTP